MLILEGSDCLGKTTFARKLLKVANDLEVFPTFYAHMSRPNCVFDFFDDYFDRITTYAIQDRFHIGGIVWHDAIEQHALSIIDRWLRTVGSITVVIYASDEEWYEDRLRKDERGNLLSLESMCNANKAYGAMVRSEHPLRPNIDFSFNIKAVGLDCRYPGEQFAKFLVDNWFKHLNLLERL